MMSVSEPGQWGLGMTRRRFCMMTGISAVGLLSGCATNPVTGQSQLMLVSEAQEIELDKAHSPHQFSADYGSVQNKSLARYIDETGQRMVTRTHRPHMPYRFRAVNAVYINAYAFPGGSIATTRGILLELSNEAELAALLGHELGHVNARHTASQMSKGNLTQAVLGGLAAAAGTQSGALGQMAAQLGMMGAGALLASYSRDNERQADALGLEYLVRSGYGGDGFIGLMAMLKRQSHGKASAIELMFATHPMSDERHDTAVAAVKALAGKTRNRPVHRDRYMDRTASVRAMAPAIKLMQSGEADMGGKRYDQAESQFKKALKKAPNDYAGLLLLAKAQTLQKKLSDADRTVAQAKQAYPEEAQAHQLSGLVRLRQKKYESALTDFNNVEQRLPGNINIAFLKGYAFEGMDQTDPAAKEYYRYLQAVQRGPQAKYAYDRLVAWGYVKKAR